MGEEGNSANQERIASLKWQSQLRDLGYLPRILHKKSPEVVAGAIRTLYEYDQGYLSHARLDRKTMAERVRVLMRLYGEEPRRYIQPLSQNGTLIFDIAPFSLSKHPYAIMTDRRCRIIIAPEADLSRLKADEYLRDFDPRQANMMCLGVKTAGFIEDGGIFVGPESYIGAEKLDYLLSTTGY